MPRRGGLRVKAARAGGRLPQATAAISGSLPVGSVLTATATVVNFPKPSTLNYKFEFYRNATNSTTGGTLVQTTNRSVNTENYTTVDADYNNYIYVVITVTNARGGAPATSASTIGAVTGQAPVINNVAVSGTVKEASTITATINYTTVGHPAVTETFQWQYSTDGSTGWTNISGATNSTYVVDIAYAGYFLRCQGSASNSLGSSGPTNSAATVRVDTLYFGDGRDGDVTWGSNSNQASGKQFRNLTVSNGVVVEVGAHGGPSLVQVCRTFTMNGAAVIHADGKVGTAGTAGSGSNTVPGGAGGNGGAGGGGDGAQGATLVNSNSAAGWDGNIPTGIPSDGDGEKASNDSLSGMAGGNGASCTATSNPTTKAHIRDNTNNWTGGGGGGSTPASWNCIKTCSGSSGTGGSGGGGHIRVLAYHCVNSGAQNKIRANGGPNSGSSGGTDQAGAGSGGGGRVSFATYDATVPFTLEANRGLGGDSGAPSTNGNTIALTGTGP